MAKGVALHVRPPQGNEEAKGHSGVEAKACTESNRTQSGFDPQLRKAGLWGTQQQEGGGLQTGRDEAGRGQRSGACGSMYLGRGGI